MKPVFSEFFVTQIRQMAKADAATVHKGVNDILANPMAHDDINWYPWDGCFEKKVGPRRIVYCVCRECEKKGVANDHTDCKAHTDETVVFRMIYTVF